VFRSEVNVVHFTCALQASPWTRDAFTQTSLFTYRTTWQDGGWGGAT